MELSATATPGSAFSPRPSAGVAAIEECAPSLSQTLRAAARKLDEYGRPVSLAAVPQKESYLISTRDLSVYRHLDRIVRSPVQSLKIEGRMKSQSTWQLSQHL